MSRKFLLHAVCIFLFGIASLALFTTASQVKATSYHTIIIDGENDFEADETFTTSSTGYTAFATWDETAVYLGYEGEDIGNGESAEKWVVWYIDTDPQCGPNGGNGTAYAAPFNTQQWSLPFAADYFVQVRTDLGLAQLNGWNGSDWTAVSHTGAVADNNDDNYLELSLPLTDMGNPENIRVVGYFIHEQPGNEWTYASWPAASLAGSDGYKTFTPFYNWYEFDLSNDGASPNDPAHNSPAQNCTIDSSTPQWFFDHDGSSTNATGGYVVGPDTVPGGVGSARLAVPLGIDRYRIATAAFAGVRLADISHLSYHTYRTTGILAQAVALQFSINYDLTDETGWQGRLIFEPYLQLPLPLIPDHTWQEWDTIDGGNGRWWATGFPGNLACSQLLPCTWDTVLSLWPNAGINFADPQFMSKVGADLIGFDGNVDNIALTVNGVNYTFDFEPLLRVHNISQGSSHLTIQEAVNEAVPGDILELDPGIFNENVVIDKSLTLRGSGDGADPTENSILDGTDNPGRGFYLNAGVTDVTIEDLRIVNYGGPQGSGIWAQGQNHNFTVQNVTSNNNGPGSISASGGIYMNGPVDNVLINNVTVHNNTGRGIVIWNGHKTNITLTNNDVRNNHCCGIELQNGTASGVTITGNHIEGNTDSGMSALGLRGGSGANLIADNTLINNGRFGMEIKNPMGTGADSGDGSIVIENNTLTFTASVAMNNRDHGGILIMRRDFTNGNPDQYPDIPAGVVIRNNSISGYSHLNQTAPPLESEGFGIVIEGANHTVVNNSISGNNIGIQEQAGLHPVANYVPYDVGSSSQNVGDSPAYFGRGNAPYACNNTIDSNAFDDNDENIRQQLAAQSDGLVINVESGESFCSIQAAIDSPYTLPGHTLQLSEGEYIESFVVDKAGLQILGPNAGINPNTGTRQPEAIIRPAISNPSPPFDACTTIALITADNVRIDGLFFDGDNPNLTSGVLVNGVDVDACKAIATDTNLNGLVVENNIVHNITYVAMYFYNSDGIATSDNYVRYNHVYNVGNNDLQYGIGTLLYNNFYADVSENVYDTVRIGLQTGNYYRVNPGVTGQISHNEINAWARGIFHNLWYSNASVISIAENNINAIDDAEVGVWNGILLTSFQNTANTLLVDNVITMGDITQLASGYNVWNTPTTAVLTISGGQVSGGDYGVFVNNYEGYNPDANNTAVTVDGVTIVDAAQAHVYVKDNPANTMDATVTAVVQNSTLTGTVNIGVWVDGLDASATLRGSLVDNATVALQADEGDLLAYANTITNFTTGVTTDSTATVNGRHNWWGSIEPVGINDDDAYDYRLGAPIAAWGEGSLADASLTTTTGTGTGIIVSHGRGAESVPFGKGNPALACSDYYDFFVLDAAGDWQVSLPVDETADCGLPLVDNSLYHFALDGTMPDLTCQELDCWQIPDGVTAVSQNLTVLLDANTFLQGTPFVASQIPTPDVLLSDDAAQSGAPGELLTYSLTVTNSGHLTGTILLNLDSEWDAVYPATVPDLGIGASTTVEVAITVPADALAGDSDTAVLTATVDGQPTLFDTANLTSSADAVHGVTVSEPSQLIGEPGSTVTHTVTITNEGNIIETILLTVDSDWSVTYPASVADLAPGTAVTVDVAVTVPVDALAGDSDTAVFTASLESDPTISDSVSLTTTAGAVYGLTVSEPSQLVGAPGGTVTHTVTITNEGNSSETILLTVDSDWSVTYPASIADLAPHTAVTVDVAITVPVDATDGDSDTAVFTASLESDPTISDSTTLTTVTGTFYGVSISGPSQLTGEPGSTVTHTVTITNEGNVSDTFDLSLGTAVWPSSLSQSSLTLAAGQSGTVVVTVTIPDTAVDEQSDSVTLTATSQADANATAVVTLTTIAEITDPEPTGYIIYLPVLMKP